MKKKIILIAFFLIWLMLFGVIALQTGSNSGYIVAFYDELFFLTLLLGFLLVAWVVVLFIQLIRQRRRNVFGVRLTTRFALAFIAVGVFPTILVYVISVQFISQTIESWFNVRVESALGAKLKLSQAEFNLQLNHLKNTATQLAIQVHLSEIEKTPLSLSSLREQANVQELLIFTDTGKIVGFSTQSQDSFIPQLPPDYVFQELRLTRLYAQVETAQEGFDRMAVAPRVEQIRVVVPIKPLSVVYSENRFASTGTRYLQIIQKIPLDVVEQSQRVLEGYTDYKQLQLSRESLKNLYGLMLTLGMLFSIIGSMFAAFYLSKRLASPLLKLAQGTEAVAQGQFNLIPLIQTEDEQDEVLQLTTGFNIMLMHLQEARRLVDVNQAQLTKSNAYLENILQSISTGVMVLDEDYNVLLANESAYHLLQISPEMLAAGLGEVPERLLVIYEKIKNNFLTFEPGRQKKYWQEQIDIQTLEEAASHTLQEHKESTLMVRGTKVKTTDEPCYVIVFDDVTEIISANRTKAWGEVARRLAHEIKNPLTPIQLSAERLALKLSQQLDEAGRKILNRGTEVIIAQVAALIKMVNEFREYARTPNVTLEKLDLNNIIEEVLLLYGLDTSEKVLLQENGRFPIDVEVDPHIPLVYGDRDNVRQIIHNLLMNAIDAIQEKYRVQEPKESLDAFLRQQRLVIRTGIWAPKGGDDAQSTSEKKVLFSVEDSGSGFASSVLNRPFEPYVTTKAQGTGLGLAIVKKIVDEHEAKIEIANSLHGGAIVKILFTKTEENAV